MNGERPFFDSNVLIYAFKEDDVRSDLAEALLAGGGVVGVQTLNEFTAVAVRKLRMLWRQIHQALADIKRLCPDAVPVSMTVREAGIKIEEVWLSRLRFVDDCGRTRGFVRDSLLGRFAGWASDRGADDPEPVSGLLRV